MVRRHLRGYPLSSSLPPAGPPSGPPDGPLGGPEYLEHGGGDPIQPRFLPRRSRKPLFLAGGGIVALGLVGGGVWAASSLLGSGAQPAEALPASTLGYASIDLDPSASQKVEAFQMLRKFPAIKDELGLASGDDLRKKLFDEIQAQASCPDLGYRVDIEPWIGDRAAVAAVDTGADAPTPVVVIQVTDEDKADAGLTKIRSCATGGASGVGGWAIQDGWAVIAETDELATTVADDAGESSLADDEEFQHWGEEVGDAGIVNLYAAPAAGRYLAEGLADLSEMTAAAGPTDPDMSAALRDFKGAAATVRFDDGALELEVAGDPGASQEKVSGTDRGDDVVANLPADTAAAVGVGFAEGWFADLVEQSAASSGGELSAAELMSKLGDEAGLDLPDDAETLAGQSLALAVGSDFDPETVFNSGDGSGVPVALEVQGDPDGVAGVLDKLRAKLGPAQDWLGSDSDGDLTAIGPDADYRARVLEGGELGDSDAFRNVVREAEDASTVVFVNFDAGDWLTNLVSGERGASDNLEPLEGLGLSLWQDGDTTHASLRLTTD
jgi:hypothetical protein